MIAYKLFYLMRFFSCILFLSFSVATIAQTPKIQQVFQWSQKNTIIQGVAFNEQGNHVAFVKRQQPDSLPVVSILPSDKNIKNLLPQPLDTTRRRDPVITQLDLTNGSTTLIDYGWSPAFSPNGSQIVYAHQQTALQGAKIIASSFRGNDLRLFNTTTGQQLTLLKPERSFLLEPVFIDSVTIVYKTGDAVNGPYAAGISLHKYNLKTKKAELVRGARIQHRLYDLMGNIVTGGKQFGYVVYSPQDSTHGLASEYSHLLFKGADTLHDFGVRHFGNLEGKFAVLPDSKIVYLDDNHLSTEDTSYVTSFKLGKVESKKPLNFEFEQAFLSPDGRFILYTNNNLEAFLLRVSDFSSIQLTVDKKNIYSVAWLQNGARFALVQESAAEPNTDILKVFSVQ